MIGLNFPAWLAAGFFCCLGLLFLLHRLEQGRRRRLAKFARPHLPASFTANLSAGRRTAKKYLTAAAMLCCFAALARPYYNFEWQDVKRKGIDIMFAVDTSKSMLAEDIKPNRLERAKFAILDFVQKLEGDRVGLLPFAGTSFLLCPLTTDYDAFSQSLDALNTDVIPTGGTNLAETIDHAGQILAGDSNHKILILLSDGENLEGDALKAAARAAEEGMTIFTIGVGTPSGKPIPLNEGSKGKFIRDEGGNFVISRLDQEKLAQIAEKTGGIYAPLDRGNGLEKIYQQKLALVPKKELTERKHKVPVQRFEWPLAAALVLLVIEYLLNSGAKPAARYLSKIKTAGRRGRRGGLSSLLFLAAVTFVSPFDAHASKGEKAYEEQDYTGAAQYYDEALTRDKDNAKLHYNHGTALYKSRNYDQAIASFNKALATDEPALQQLAYYNLGNSFYQKGQLSLKDAPEKTIEQWEKSLEFYQSALALAPDFENAGDNLELVRKKLEMLKKRQQEKQKQQKQQQDQKKQDKQKKSGQDKQEQDKQGQKNSPQQDQQQKGQKDQQQGKPEEQQKKDGGESSQTDQQKSGQPGEKKERDKQDGQNQQGKKKHAPPEQADNQQKGNGQQQAVEPVKPKPGEMSEEDARQLLESLKSEEGNLNLIPRKNKEKPRKDW